MGLNKYILILFYGLTLLSCVVPEQPSFQHMSDEELISYNSTRPLQQNVICFKQRKTGSHIADTRCLTLSEMASERGQSRPLNALVNDPRIYSSPNRISRD